MHAHMPATRPARARTRTDITGAEASLPRRSDVRQHPSIGGELDDVLVDDTDGVVCTWPRRLQTVHDDGIVVRGSGGGERASVLSVLSRREVELTLSYTRDR